MTRLVVLGTGNIGLRHLEAARRISGLSPIAVPKRPSRLPVLAKQGYDTASDLRTASRLGAKLCIVASDTGCHASDGLEAIRRGMDVLIEKPLASNEAEGKRLLAAARKSKRRLFTACVLRFSESLNAFRALLPKVGRAHHVRIECQGYLPDWPRERHYRKSYSASARQGGVLRDLIHEIDYAGWLFGWPQTVRGEVRNLKRLGIASDESADLLWTVPGGPTVSVHVDYLTRPPRRRMRASGEKGCLSWDGYAQVVRWEPAAGAAKTVRFRQVRDGMLLEQARAFLGAARGKTDPRLATAADGLRALAVCDAARRSARSRREERVA